MTRNVDEARGVRIVTVVVSAYTLGKKAWVYVCVYVCRGDKFQQSIFQRLTKTRNNTKQPYPHWNRPCKNILRRLTIFFVITNPRFTLLGLFSQQPWRVGNCLLIKCLVVMLETMFGYVNEGNFGSNCLNIGSDTDHHCVVGDRFNLLTSLGEYNLGTYISIGVIIAWTWPLHYSFEDKYTEIFKVLLSVWEF